MMVMATCQHIQETPVTPMEGVGGEKTPAICYMENELESWCLVSISMTVSCILLTCQNMIPNIRRKQIRIFHSKTGITRAQCRCLENSSFEEDRFYLKFPRRTWSKWEVPSYSIFSMPTSQWVEETD